MKLSDFTAGTRVYSARHKSHGTVDHPARTLVHVKMDETGKIVPLPVDDLSIVTETRAQRVFRETPPKLRSTRFTRERQPQAPQRETSRQRRIRTRSSGYSDVSRMMTAS